MPTYDYECDACGHGEEVFQTFSEEPLDRCPKCRKKKFRRRIGAGAAIIFKGSGFYGTDYRSDSYKESAKKDSEGSCSGNPKSCDGPCTTAKPDAKPDSNK